ncbi:hypothetical protein GGR51DRAFT_526757 [Nemania sp. FL0031]|nr:hypothetical protein GGR51DRAFT_526757 [Nemania sp. FL0031]
MPQHRKLDDDPNPNKYLPVREAILRKQARDVMSRQPPKIDRDMELYEEYLRNKWNVTDLMPETFDPDKLEGIMKARFPRRSMDERTTKERERVVPAVQQDKDSLPARTKRHTTPPQASSRISDVYNSNDAHPHSSPARASGHLQAEERSRLESEDEVKHQSKKPTNNKPKSPKSKSTRPRSNSHTFSRSIPDSPERASTPRIGSGSKPPLSRSAFAEGGGVPCTDEKCKGACKQGIKVKGHDRPPQYFPFNSKSKRSRSRSRSRERQKTGTEEEEVVVKSWI